MSKWLGCPDIHKRLSRVKYQRYMVEVGRLSRLSPPADSLELLILDDEAEANKAARHWWQHHWHENFGDVRAPKQRLRAFDRPLEQLTLWS
jgi:hypothetical protein